MRIALAVAVVALLVLVVAGALWWRAVEPPTDDDARAAAEEQVGRFLAEHPADVTLDLRRLTRGDDWAELVDPASALPRSHEWPREALAAIDRYERSCEGEPPQPGEGESAALRRARRFALWRCDAARSLDEAPPEEGSPMHNSGRSYAALAFAARPGPGAEAWVRARLNRVHAAELGGLGVALGPEREVLVGLETRALSALARGKAAVLGARYLLLREPSGGPAPAVRYRAWSRATWDDALAGAGVEATSSALDGACISTAGGLCWIARAGRRGRSRLLAGVALGAAGVLALALLGLGVARRIGRRRELEARRFILRTLTHELRTPATSLSLALEAFRGAYDELPDACQEAFLSMSSELGRLRRTLAASGRYLALQGDVAGEAGAVASLNELARDVLEGWPEAEFVCLEPDRGLRIDGEWLRVCVANLVDNAFRHGAPPVGVTLEMEGDTLVVRVRDSGGAHGLTLEQMSAPLWRADGSRGLGLGLSIVRQAAEEILGGGLVHRAGADGEGGTVMELRVRAERSR